MNNTMSSQANLTAGAGVPTAPPDGNLTAPPQSPGASDSSDLACMLVAVCWSMTCIAALFLGTRLFVKLTTQRRLWWDDHILVASWCALVAFSSTMTYGTKYGLGTHLDMDATTETKSHMQLVVVIATVFSVMGAAWSKTSFAIMLLRITKGTMKYVIWFIMISMNLVLTFNAILQFLWCQPAYVAWHSGQGGTCWSKNVIVYYSVAAASYSATMDILLAMVPWAVIMKLQMQTREKIGIAVCMSLGVIAALTSILRAVHIPTLYSSDYTYNEAQLFIWTAAELATTIVAASIPVLRALLHDIVHSTHRTGGKTGVINTFKSGTYMCSTVSRSQSYRKMDSDSAHANKHNRHLADISEHQSAVSLGLSPEDNHDRGQHQFGILKTEEIEVVYDRRSRNKSDGGVVDKSESSFELGEVSPTYIRPNSR